MPVFFALAFWVACCANSYKVGRGVVKLVAVHVVNMKKFTRSGKLCLAKLTSVIVSLTDIMGNPFPRGRITPFRNATLPGGIFRTAHRFIDNQSFASCARFYSEFLHKLPDSPFTNTNLVRNIREGAVLVYIFLTQPIGMFVRCIAAVVVFSINVPLVLAPIPRNQITTSAFTKWNIANGWEVLDRFASLPARMRFDIIASGNVISHKNIPNGRWSNVQFLRNRLRPIPTTIGGRSCVKKNNFSFNISGGFFHEFQLKEGIRYE